MTEQTMWLISGAIGVFGLVVGFLLGRGQLGGAKRIESLEAEVARQKDEIAGYKRDVESHFDKTATLVASMAGSYKDLFEHLSSGYEELSGGSARQLFKDRVVGLLVGGTAPAAVDQSTPKDKVAAALLAAGAEPPASQPSESEKEPAGGAEESAAATGDTPAAAAKQGKSADTKPAPVGSDEAAKEEKEESDEARKLEGLGRS